MLEGKNNTFSLFWEIRSIFMQNCFIVSALQHGRRENPLKGENSTKCIVLANKLLKRMLIETSNL